MHVLYMLNKNTYGSGTIEIQHYGQIRYVLDVKNTIKPMKVLKIHR